MHNVLSWLVINIGTGSVGDIAILVVGANVGTDVMVQFILDRYVDTPASRTIDIVKLLFASPPSNLKPL